MLAKSHAACIELDSRSFDMCQVELTVVPMRSAMAPEPWVPDARDLLAIARSEAMNDRNGRAPFVLYDSVGGQS